MPEKLTPCGGCQFGASPDYCIDSPELSPYRREGMRNGDELRCHRDPTQLCKGFARERRNHPGLKSYFYRQSEALVRHGWTPEEVARDRAGESEEAAS